MKKKYAIWAVGIVLGALVLAWVGRLVDEQRPDAADGAAATPRPSPALGSPTPSPAVDPSTPSPSASLVAEPTGIHLTHLTDGYRAKEGDFLSATTEPVLLRDDTVTIVHLFSCCDHADPPVVTAGDTTFDLVVTHSAGEKRHWVYRAVGADVETPITFQFDVSQNIAQWIVDEAAGVPTTANGADAIGATAWQDSKANATSGSIDLAATTGAVVGFGAIGSGPARDVSPEPGYEETAEVGPGSYQIFTFWSPAPDSNLAATFVDESGTPQVMSWLFLAAELLPAS